jgi:hypothetical protein
MAAFRLAFGLLGLVGALRFFGHGWLRSLYLFPPDHFSYWGFGWVKPWPREWMLDLHTGLLAAAALALALGRWPRLSSSLYLLLFLLLELWDKAAYLNHYYLVSLLAGLLGVAAWSSRGLDRQDGLPDWLLTALRLQFALVWTFAGLAKLQGDWLLRGLPLSLWLPTRSDLPLLGPLLALPATALAASWIGAAVDLLAAAGLCWRRSRPWTLALLWAFHLATGLLFPRIGLFPGYMLAGTLLFLDPEWPQALASLVRRRAWRDRAARDAVLGGATLAEVVLPPSRLGRGAFALYVALQLALPLRHWLYPGDVLWTEEGFRFSWMVMLVERSGSLSYELRDPTDGRTWTVEAAEFLTPLQAQQAATQPDMILEAAHWLADRYRAQGHSRLEVRADAWVSVNGRPAARLVDPAVDLASRRRGLLPADWLRRAP